MHLLIAPALSLLFSRFLWEVATRKVNSTLSVSNGGKWGEWGEAEFCPQGYIEGFSLKFPKKYVGLFDYTGLTGIRGFCADGSFVTSSVGEGGTWSWVIGCRFDHLDAFSLQVTEPRGALADDTAVNNIKFKCVDGSELEGNGPAWGKYGKWSKACNQFEMCGIQTKVEKPKGFHMLDRTGLNDVRFFCCE